MSAPASLITSIVKRPAAVSDDYLIIEQEPWVKGVGSVTRLDLVRALEAVIFGEESEGVVDCGVDDDGCSYTTLVFVYPSPASLAFEVGLTNGSFALPVIVDVRVRESVAFSLTDEKELSYPVKTFVSSEWADKVWGVAGGEVSVTPPTVDDQSAVVSEKVYGTAYIEYITTRWVYNVNVPVRESDPENIFQSVFYAWWRGGIKMEELAAPDGAEYGYVNNMSCVGTLTSAPDPDGEPPQAFPVNRHITIDYCDTYR